MEFQINLISLIICVSCLALAVRLGDKTNLTAQIIITTIMIIWFIVNVLL